jgi:hypothetical protein
MHPHIPYTVDGHWSPASSGDTCDASSCLPPCFSLDRSRAASDEERLSGQLCAPCAPCAHASRDTGTTRDRNAPALQPLYIRMASVARAAEAPRGWRVATRHGFVGAGAGVRVWVRLRVHGRGHGGEVARKHHAMPHPAPQPAPRCCHLLRELEDDARRPFAVAKGRGCRGAASMRCAGRIVARRFAASAREVSACKSSASG